MAQFKIYLLTPSVVDVNEENSFNQRTSYLKTTISEFYSQQEEFNKGIKTLTDQKNTYTFTFDEKIAFHKNAQKELTFSMLRNIWVENEFVVNPFISALSIGTQILLEDKDENEHIFTVKNINYTPMSENMLYAYTCQDSFSYQGARQNSGYTIDNDSSSEDFIGAENIDFWANRIKTDCHIGYDYLGLEKVLWLNNDNNLSEDFNIEGFKKYIKKPYNEKEHKDYFATIPFSVSGSNASAALISLAEQLGLMLRVYEKSYKEEDNRHYIKSYFWLEPEKHEEVSGLKYSPYSSIQSFSFSHAGESLSTVLNVESNTFDDELITLLPDVPEFFVEYFDSKEWDESSFYSGFFTSLCTGKVFKSKDTDGSDFTIEDSYFIENNSILELKLTQFEIPDFYKNYRFNIDSDESELYLSTERQTPYISKWVLGYYKKDENENETSEWVELKKEGGITSDVLKENPNLYIRINHTLKEVKNDPDIAHVNLTINFYRDATQEELDFAVIADKCPWLENKLIDFSYFLENKIINKSEYNRLQSIVKDSLRKVNGRLLSYTKDFYQATKDKIETISNLTNDIDSVGAAFQADVLDSYADCGNVDDISYFRTAYSKWASSKDENEKTELLHLNNLLADYANKYFKTQQRFLKNIYSFKNYFEAPVVWNGKNTTIYEKELNIQLEGSQFVFFSNNAFEKWTNNTSAVRIGEDGKASKMLFKKDLKTEFEYVHGGNYTNYKYSDYNPDNFISSDEYDSNRQYYRHAIKIAKDKVEDKNNNTIAQIHVVNERNFYYHYHEGDYVYYILPGKPIFDNSVDLDSEEIEGVIEVLVTKSDMTREWLYSNRDNDSNILNYLYSKGDIAYVDNFPTDAEILQMSKWIDIDGDFSSLVDLIVEANYEIDPLLWISVYTSPGDSAEKKFKKTYQETFPIDNLYIKHKSLKWSADNKQWEEVSENEVFHELPFVKRGNYTSYYCRTAVVTWPWEDNIRWRTGGGLCTHYWDGSNLTNESGFVSKSKTVYAPTSTSKKNYDTLKKETEEDSNAILHYENYYKFVADTYKSARKNNENYTDGGIYKKYYYRSKILKVINGSNNINKYSTYKIIPIDNSDGCVKQGFINTILVEKNTNEFSSVTYFPIVALSSEIDLTSYDWKDKQEECSVNEILKAFIPNSGTWKYNSTNKTWSDLNTTLLVLIEQDYTEQYFNSDENKVWESLETFAQKDLYDQNHLLFKPENQDGYATNFLFKKELKETLKDFEESDNTMIFDPSRAYYTKDGVRVYTAVQLQKEGIAYYLKDSDTIKFTSYSREDNSFSTQVNIYDNGIIKNLGYMTLTPAQEEDDQEQPRLAISVVDKDTKNKYISFITEQREISSTDLKNYTNAQLWSEFHSETESPLFEDAARIETQLEEYWLQAYNASKYCEYFLPEHWQPSTDGKRNYFSELVFNPDNLQLSNKIIPNVNIVKEQNTTLLPKYNFTMKTTENDELLPSLCSQNKAIKNAFEILDIANNEDWAGQPLNLNTTYYAAESGTGMKWVEVLGRLVPGSEQAFNKFNGIYPMTFRFLKDNFVQKELVDYEIALEEHNKIWDNLYKFFPGLILETSYSNPDATTSQDLFTLATNYFRDLSRPERGYNISIIDAAKLLGYKGQELHIGDSIQVDAEEFYDEYDDVKKTLSQHLFITDISYNLRKDTDIQLTVNSIKYQDKLIQRLAKLIIK